MINFQCNKKSDDHVELVESMLSNLQEIECNISIKIYLLHSHLGRLAQNRGDFSEEQWEKFHEDIRTMEEKVGLTFDGRLLLEFAMKSTVVPSRKYYKRSFDD